MATREFEFVVGPETSTLPTVGTPVDDDDLLSLGYANENYTQGGLSVADITALKAVADDTNRDDGDLRLVQSTDNLYRFNSGSAAAGDDNFVVVPDAGTGRWIRVTILNRANTFTDVTDSSSKDTGSMILEGGLGVEKNVYVGGNLTVDGTTTTVNSATLEVTDANITINNGGTQATADAADSGLTVEMSDATDVLLGYDSTLTSRWKAGDVGSESEVLTAGTAQTVSGVKTHTAELIMDNQKGVQFKEQTGNGTAHIEVVAPDDVSASVTFKLPDGQSTGTQFLSNDGSGNLDWASPGVGGQLTTDLQSANTTVATGSSLFHPNLIIDTGFTYTINGALVGAISLTVNGTLTVAGDVTILT